MSPLPSRKRPRGLWKGKTQLRMSNADNFSTTFSEGYVSEQERADQTPFGALKRRKQYLSSKASAASRAPSVANDLGMSDVPRVVVDRNMARRPGRVRMSSIKEGTKLAMEDVPGYEDWENLRELFDKAVEQYEDDEHDAVETFSLLRRVVHECCRFLVRFQDPSVLFTCGSSSRHWSESPPDHRVSKGGEDPSGIKDVDTNAAQTGTSAHHHAKSSGLPTAFHSLFGTALFLFGNLVAQNPAHVEPGEPNMPCPYWLAALDIFVTGENLPSRTDGRSPITVQDWRMAIIWGRTLVCLADMSLTRTWSTKTSTAATAIASSIDDTTWDPDSPLAALSSRRPPSTQRISLSRTSPHDLMVLAMDQFSRGIFHMPHPHQVPCCPNEHFSRPKELFTIASEVLGIAERLDEVAHRKYWAAWADSVFSQMKMEADKDVWRGPITRARGRCWLIIGSACAEPLEAGLEAGYEQVLESELAQDARHALTQAISFFERAKGSAMSWLDPESQELQPLMTEALLTLANVTLDKNKREELYSRAQAESGNSLVLDTDDQMDQSD